MDSERKDAYLDVLATLTRVGVRMSEALAADAEMKSPAAKAMFGRQETAASAARQLRPLLSRLERMKRSLEGDHRRNARSNPGRAGMKAPRRRRERAEKMPSLAFPALVETAETPSSIGMSSWPESRSDYRAIQRKRRGRDIKPYVARSRHANPAHHTASDEARAGSPYNFPAENSGDDETDGWKTVILSFPAAGNVTYPLFGARGVDETADFPPAVPARAKIWRAVSARHGMLNVPARGARVRGTDHSFYCAYG